YYPSLFSFSKKSSKRNAIMCGPLSLVNHSCEVDIGFKKMKKKPAQLPVSWNEWTFVTIKPDDYHFPAGAEILVKYCECHELWFKCSFCCDRSEIIVQERCV